MANRKNAGAELAAPVREEKNAGTELTAPVQEEKNAGTEMAVPAQEKEAEKQFVVHAPESRFTGTIGGVRFVSGEGLLKSDDSRMLSWFKENGYSITEKVNQ